MYAIDYYKDNVRIFKRINDKSDSPEIIDSFLKVMEEADNCRCIKLIILNIDDKIWPSIFDVLNQEHIMCKIKTIEIFTTIDEHPSLDFVSRLKCPRSFHYLFTYTKNLPGDHEYCYEKDIIYQSIRKDSYCFPHISIDFCTRGSGSDCLKKNLILAYYFIYSLITNYTIKCVFISSSSYDSFCNIQELCVRIYNLSGILLDVNPTISKFGIDSNIIGSPHIKKDFRTQLSAVNNKAKRNKENNKKKNATFLSTVSQYLQIN